MIGFAVVVGAFIGVVITWQTLQGAILANIKEFASLRALGVSMGSLRLIVMELSLWVGAAGLLLTALLTGGIWGVGQDFWRAHGFPAVYRFTRGDNAARDRHPIRRAVARHSQEKPAGGSAAMSSLAIDAKGLSKAYKIGKKPAAGAQERRFHGLPRPGHHGHGALRLG